MTQDTGKFRTNTKDQFYTAPAVAKRCVTAILEKFPQAVASDWLWIEPSAGSGAFLTAVPNGVEKVGIDLEPASTTVQKEDFLTWEPPTGKQIVLFGNPPFGRQSSLAKAFIVKGCRFAKIIAFILPKSFVKPSMNKAFDMKFHCRLSMELEPDSFLLNGVAYDVPCVFQIWERMDMEREAVVAVEPIGFRYVKSTNEGRYDFVFRRVGVYAGRCHKAEAGVVYSAQTHYFIKLDDGLVGRCDEVVKKVSDHVFPSNTVGPRSLSKPEANEVINQILSSSS